MTAPKGEDPNPKKEVTSEPLMVLPNISNMDHEKREAYYERKSSRYTALNHAVQLEAARNLTEAPEDITNRILSRAEAFYNYLQTDKEISE